MLQIPLSPVPAQSLNIVLAGQACSIAVVQRNDALYMDLVVNGEPVAVSRVCRNRIRILLDSQYHGFIGDLVMVDTHGDTQPQYAGLGDRYALLYLESSDLA